MFGFKPIPKCITSELDNKHKDSAKVFISASDIFNEDDSNLLVIYCSLGGCSSWTKPCKSEGYCPYGSREFVQMDQEEEYKQQKLIFTLENEMQSHEAIMRFATADFNENDEQFFIELEQALALKVSSSKLEKLKDYHPVFEKAIIRKKQLEKVHKEEWDNRTPRFTQYGDYLYIKIDGLPSPVGLWHETSIYGNWIKLEHINKNFFDFISKPDFIWSSKEKLEKYNKDIELLKKQLEEKYEIMTMIELTSV